MALTFGSMGFTKVTNPTTGQPMLIDRATGQRRSASGGPVTASTSTTAKKKTGGWVDNGTVKYNVNGKTYSVKPASQGGYMDAFAKYQTDRTNQLNAYRQQLDNTLAQNNATTNANYDSSARQAYVDYMRKQKALPSQLQTLGVNGGATESALLNLYNNYGSSHAANEQQRNADLTANQQSREDAYNTAYLDYLGDLNTQRQTAINNQINQYNNEITQFSASIAHYPTTQKGYEAYGKEIKALKKGKDPLKDIKIALLMQQRSTQFPKGLEDIQGASGSGGGGGGGSRRRYGGSRRSGGGSGGSSSSSSGSGSNSGLPDFTGVNKSVASALRKAVGKKTTVKKGDRYTRISGNRLSGGKRKK